jgi:hypothetical protein
MEENKTKQNKTGNIKGTQEEDLPALPPHAASVSFVLKK